MKKTILKILFIVVSFFIAHIQVNADTIVLKNGNRIEVQKAWEEGNSIKAEKASGTIGYPKAIVETVIHEEQETQSGSFEFNMWKAGITVNEAIKIAESHEIPLARTGDIAVGNKIHPNVYKHIYTTKELHYRTKLMDRDADITLYFTPTGRVMHKLEVRIDVSGAETGELRDEILYTLKDKYNSKNKNEMKKIGNKRIWTVEDIYTVKMVTVPGYIYIEYSDNALADQNEAEKSEEDSKKWKEYLEQRRNR